MRKLSERVGRKDTGVVLEDLPKIDFTTITGRKVRIGKMHGVHHRRILQASKGIDGRDGTKAHRQEDWSLTKWLLDELVSVLGLDGNEKRLNYQTLSIGEEMDLLLLMRLASLGRMLEFEYTCTRAVCGAKTAQRFDVGHIKRLIMLPADEEHIAYQLCKYDAVDDTGDDELTVDFSELGDDYYDYVHENHRDWSCKTPDRGFHIEFHLPMARDKAEMGKLYNTDDIAAVEKTLATVITAVDGTSYRDENGLRTNRKQQEELVRFLKAMSTRDLLWIRDAMEEEDFGVDNEVQIVCKTEEGGCGTLVNSHLAFNSSFFLPRRVDSKRSFGRTQRYAPETSRSTGETG